MAKKKEKLPPLGSRRRSFYDFTKDYPGSRYAQAREKDNTEIYDTKGKIKLGLKIFGIVVLFLLAYFVIYMLLEISHQPIG